jgi:hypothetical protein
MAQILERCRRSPCRSSHWHQELPSISKRVISSYVRSDYHLRLLCSTIASLHFAAFGHDITWGYILQGMHEQRTARHPGHAPLRQPVKVSQIVSSFEQWRT